MRILFSQPCRRFSRRRVPNPVAIGDGKIFVLPLDDCYRIRTGESGRTAIGP